MDTEAHTSFRNSPAPHSPITHTHIRIHPYFGDPILYTDKREPSGWIIYLEPYDTTALDMSFLDSRAPCWCIVGSFEPGTALRYKHKKTLNEAR